MPKARRRKDSSFETSVTKSVFLYGDPNKEKLALLKQMQDVFTALVNEKILMLDAREDLILQLVKNDKKDTVMRSLEKAARRKGLNSAFCQNAFDMAVTCLSNRLDTIRLDLLSEGAGIFARSKVLFAMSIMGKTKTEMISAMESLKKDFYLDCASELRTMTDAAFALQQTVFQDLYAMKCLEYRIPQLRSVSVPLDSRLMTVETSKQVKAAYVIRITDPFQKNHRIQIPIDTSTHSLHKINSQKMAGTVMMQVRKKKLRIGWAYTRHIEQPKTAETVGVDVGITDSFHTSDGRQIGSMKEVIGFYHDTVEPSFAGQSDLRNKIRKINYYLRSHDLSDDVRRSLIEKMDRLSSMMQTMEAPYRKKRAYYHRLDAGIASAVHGYLQGLSHDTLTVLEKLDMREFKKSRRTNGMFSLFARGKLQHRLMEELNWRGFDFLEVAPDYTSQVCPVCNFLDDRNRDRKEFTCTCCGYHNDADHVGAINIRARASDKEILEICERNKYNHKNLQSALRTLYAKRHQEYNNTESV